MQSAAAVTLACVTTSKKHATQTTFVQQSSYVSCTAMPVKGMSLAAKASDGAAVSRHRCSDAGVSRLIRHHSSAVGCELTSGDDDWIGQRCIDVQATAVYGAVVEELHLLQDHC